MKLSVIIPLYNGSSTIEKTINSINFKLLDFIDEIIIYNDGSIDNSKKIVSNLIKKNNKIKLYSSEVNRGGGYARNFAINKAKNKLIFVLDSDDLVHNQSLKKLYTHALKNNLRAHFSKAHYFSNNENKINDKMNFFKIYDGKITYQKYLKKLTSMPNFIFSKKDWKTAKMYPENSHWDTQNFAAMFLKNVGNVSIASDTLYFHRRFRKNYKSYYERQETSGENFFNSYKLFEVILEDLNVRKLSFLIKKNIFISMNIISLLELNNKINCNFKYKNLKIIKELIEIMIFVKKNNLKKSKFLLKKYLLSNNIIITDLILFLIIRSDKTYSNKQYNEFKKSNNFFNFIRIFKKYPNSTKLIFFYLKFLGLVNLKKLKNYIV